LIENQGPGAAQNVAWQYDEGVVTLRECGISTTLIGSGSSAQVTVDQGKLSRGLIISYNSLDGRAFTTKARMEGGILVQQQSVILASSEDE
jgi:hypothetical protein